jgi:hypothetical protein
MRSLRSLLWTLPLVAGCAVTGGSAGLPTDHLAEGTWGGNDNGVIVTATQLHIHLGCTNGDFPAPVLLDAEGRFRLDGSYTLRAFPVARESLPAQVAGRVEGRRLTFTIAVNDTVLKRPTALGPITVTLGVEPRMTICPICEKPGL